MFGIAINNLIFQHNLFCIVHNLGIYILSIIFQFSYLLLK